MGNIILPTSKNKMHYRILLLKRVAGTCVVKEWAFTLQENKFPECSN